MGEQAVLLSVDDFTLLFWVAGSCLRKGGGESFSSGLIPERGHNFEDLAYPPSP